MIVGKFIVNGKVFVITRVNNKFWVGKKENSKINYDLSNLDKKIAFKVLEGITPQGKERFIINTAVNGKTFDVYFQRESKTYSFKPLPSTLDLSKLNRIFNNQNEFCLSGNFKNSNFYKRLVKFGKQTVVVAFVASLNLGLATSILSDVKTQFINDKVNVTEQEVSLQVLDNASSIEDIIPDDFTDLTKVQLTDEMVDSDSLLSDLSNVADEALDNEALATGDIPEDANMAPDNFFDEFEGGYGNEENLDSDIKIGNVSDYADMYKSLPNILGEERLNKIKHYLDANPYLTDAEKEFFFSNKEFLSYAKLSLNEEDLKRFADLKIIYHPESNGFIEGTYSDKSYFENGNLVYDDVIDIYNASNFEVSSEGVLNHEYSHFIEFLSSNFNASKVSPSSFFMEGINTIYTNEFFGVQNKHEGYDQSSYNEFLVPVIHTLMEIVGTEVVEKIYTENSMDYVVAELEKIVPDKNMIDTFLDDTYSYGQMELSEERGSELQEDLQRKIIEEISAFYEAKYGKKAEDDLLVSYYLNFDNLNSNWFAAVGLEENEDNTFNMRMKTLKSAPYYVNPKYNKNPRKYIFDAPTAHHFEYYTYEKDDLLSYAQLNGWDIVDGDVVIPEGVKVSENGEFLVPYIAFSDYQEFIIDDNNRYISRGQSR